MSRRMRWALCGLMAVLLVLAISRMTKQNTGASLSPLSLAQPAAASTLAGPARFGPGELSPSDDMPPARSDTEAPSGLAVNAEGHLVVNKALHNVLDYF